MDKQLISELKYLLQALLNSSKELNRIARMNLWFARAGTNETDYQFPPDARVASCLEQFLNLMASKLDNPASLPDLHDPNEEHNVWWAYAYFGLLLYHVSKQRFPLEVLLLAIVLQLEAEINDGQAVKKQMPSSTIANLLASWECSSPANWQHDIDARARALWLNCRDRLIHRYL